MYRDLNHDPQPSCSEVFAQTRPPTLPTNSTHRVIQRQAILKNLIKHNESKAVGNTVPLLAWSPWGGQYKAIQPSNTSDRLTFISSPHVHHIHHVLGDITQQKNASREVEFLDSCPIQNTIAVEIRRLKQKLFMLLHFTPDSVPTLMAVLKSSSAT